MANGRSNITPGEKDAFLQSGIDILGTVPWGTHFCQFYVTSQDLIEILVPYFRAGLKANEFCMWITSIPLQVDQALDALRLEVPDLDRLIEKGQIEVLDYTEWYLPGGRFDANAVLQGWTDKLAAARQKGYQGLRLTGNTFWLEQANWGDFTLYEEKINEIIGTQRMLALCTYSLEKCGAYEIMEVIANHQFALIKNTGKWEIIESAKHRKMEQALRESEERYHNLFEKMTEGFALHEIICDDTGKAVDYRFLEVNPAFEQMTGLPRARVVGRRVLEVLPEVEPSWIEIYGQVALTGMPMHFQNYTRALGKYYDVVAFSPERGKFAALFIDITESKHLEEETSQQAARVEVQRLLIEQREQERLQIARDLHDGPLQQLIGVSFDLQMAIDATPDSQTYETLEEIRLSIQEHIDELRSFAGELRPPILSKFGLEKAMRSHLETFQEKHPEMKVNFTAMQEGQILPEAPRLALYRIFQEAMNNVIRHSKASQVNISLTKTDRQVELNVEDNGQGFEVPTQWLEQARKGHLGLVGIRERAEAIGGTVEVKSHPGKGTFIRVSVPI
ncbi:MAG: MEDS domain-containing protein [Chloroflexi bacterium]|nr:MEDS domain-containing protein [Chloroflexota bacterium]